MDLNLSIRPFEESGDLEVCARMMCSSEPWITLERGYEESAAVLRDSSRERYVAESGGELAGFVIVNMAGAFVGYIQTVCVAPEFRGQGIGTKLVRFAEERIFRESPNVFLCISSTRVRDGSTKG
jgi:ribosomal protein S18 acetylase RimI-like enzyme